VSADGPVRVEQDGNLTIVTLDSPPLNLLDAAMETALRAAFDELEAAELRAVLFQAEGRAVSGGVDVGVFAAQADVSSATALFERWLELMLRIERLPCPTVFAAHALCLTWAFEFALACDLIVAAEKAKFGLVEKVVGLTPTMGGTQRLAERAGGARALEFVMTGVPYDAATLERWNVVNRVLPDVGFHEAVREFAMGLADGPTRAHAATKEVVRAFREGGVPLANERAVTVAAELFDTEDLRSAVNSFLTDGPGKATFTGR
jgi:enoyl-CoA hydratase/carnithine racemase